MGNLQYYKNLKKFIISSTSEVIPGGRLSVDPSRDDIHLDGCGCFLLFQGERKVGRAYLVNHPGYHYYNLIKIGSVYKEVISLVFDQNVNSFICQDCSRLEQYRTAQLVIISAVGVLVFCCLSLLAAVTFKKCKNLQYDAVTTEGCQ